MKEKSGAEKIQIEDYRKMTAAQKWQEFYRLREIAWQIKAAAIRAKNPNWTEQDVVSEVRKIFLYAIT